VHHHAPDTPIILVGTKSDLREDDDILARMRERHMAPTSFVAGLALAKEICNAH